MEFPSPDRSWVDGVSANGGPVINEAWSSPTRKEADDDGLPGSNRCGRGGRSPVLWLTVIRTRTNRRGNITYHSFSTDEFGDDEGVRRGENKAVLRFQTADRDDRWLVITGGGADYDDPDLGIGPYVAQIQAGTLAVLWADGVRVKDVSVSAIR